MVARRLAAALEAASARVWRHHWRADSQAILPGFRHEWRSGSRDWPRRSAGPVGAAAACLHERTGRGDADPGRGARAGPEAGGRGRSWPAGGRRGPHAARRRRSRCCSPSAPERDAALDRALRTLPRTATLRHRFRVAGDVREHARGDRDGTARASLPRACRRCPSGCSTGPG